MPLFFYMKNSPLLREPAGPLKVDVAQAGMKLLRFLERSLAGQPRSALHKWIRTGQVRVNGKRARAFDILRAGDEIRLPPFAGALSRSGRDRSLDRSLDQSRGQSQALGPVLGPGLDIVAVEKDYLVLAKAGGLPSQGGSGHADSVASRLALAFAGAPYVPAPAHRLDRDSSGLLLAGAGFAAQKALQALFRDGALSKDYLVWIAGPPAFAGPALLADHLQTGRDPASGREKMFCLPGGHSLELDSATQEELATLPATFFAPARAVPQRPGQERFLEAQPAARPALSLALPLWPQAADFGPCLLLLRLFTGRKHQIRVQLAARGHYVLGDRRYGPGPVPGQPLLPHFSPQPLPPLLLHAWRLRFAWPPAPDASGVLSEARKIREYRLLPAWPPPFEPAPSVLEEAALLLDALVRERLTAFLPKPLFL